MLLVTKASSECSFSSWSFTLQRPSHSTIPGPLFYVQLCVRRASENGLACNPSFACTAGHVPRSLIVPLRAMAEGGGGVFVMLYPTYVDSDKSWSGGRRVPLQCATPAPSARELARACEHLQLKHTLESGKTYPREPRRKGRVRAELFDSEHRPVLPSLPNRHRLYIEVGKAVKALNPNRELEVEHGRKQYRTWLENACAAVASSSSDSSSAPAQPLPASQPQQHAQPQLPQQQQQQQQQQLQQQQRQRPVSTAGVKGSGSGKKGKGKKR